MFATTKKEDRLRLLVLSDLLKAEVGGEPIHYARYIAKFKRRKDTLSDLNNEDLTHQLGANLVGLTFSGLVSTRSPLARKVLADCRRVYNAMRDHYEEHVYEQRVVLKDLAATLKPPMPTEGAVYAASILMRNSGANIIVDTQPAVTAESKLQGNHDLLEKSFTQRVRERREELARKRAELTQLRSRRPFNFTLGQEEVTAPEAGWLFALLDEMGSEEVKKAWAKCNTRGTSEPDGAITAARSLVETVCKQLLDDRKIVYKPDSKLPDLYKQVRQALRLDPTGAANSALQTIFQGCTAVVNGLGELRNAMGDSHGPSASSPKASHRHARLAVALAGAIASFLLTTDDARKTP